MNTTAEKLATNDIAFSGWLAQVRAKFEQPEEFELAAEIYSFASCYEEGMSPDAAFEDFDAWVST